MVGSGAPRGRARRVARTRTGAVVLLTTGALLLPSPALAQPAGPEVPPDPTAPTGVSQLDPAHAVMPPAGLPPAAPVAAGVAPVSYAPGARDALGARQARSESPTASRRRDLGRTGAGLGVPALDRRRRAVGHLDESRPRGQRARGRAPDRRTRARRHRPDLGGRPHRGGGPRDARRAAGDRPGAGRADRPGRGQQRPGDRVDGLGARAGRPEVRHAGPVGRRRVEDDVAAADDAGGARGDHPPHQRVQRLLARRLPGHRPRDLRVPLGEPGLGRHRLQRPRRQVRDDLRGARGRARPQRHRRARGRVQPRDLRHRDDGQLPGHAGDPRRDGVHGGAGRVEARRALPRPAPAGAAHVERRGHLALPEGPVDDGAGAVRAPGRGPHVVPGRRRLRADGAAAREGAGAHRGRGVGRPDGLVGRP